MRRHAPLHRECSMTLVFWLHRIRHQEACSVCLGEYEVDESVKRLPPCGHEFHAECINQWLINHTTCPMCRHSLLPQQVAKFTHTHTHTHTRYCLLQFVEALWYRLSCPFHTLDCSTDFISRRHTREVDAMHRWNISELRGEFSFAGCSCRAWS